MLKAIRFTLCAILFSASAHAHADGTALRLSCDGDSTGASVTINGQFKGECPLDVQVAAGTFQIRAVLPVNKYKERVFEQVIRLGDGVVKRVDIQLGAPQFTAEGQRLENERLAQEAEKTKQAAEAKRLADEDAKRIKAERLAQVLTELKSQGIEPGNGKRFRDCPDCPELVAIPPGEFTRFGGGIPHDKVKIDYVMAVGAYPVTFDEWDRCERENACPHADEGSMPGIFFDTKFGRGRQPVVNVSWDDLQKYLAWLNRKTGKTYRLLSEAEWEYACLGGLAPTTYCGGENLDSLAWYSNNSGDSAHPVGQKQPNGFGLYDMSGNVWDYTNDCWGNDCAWRVLRGGSWGDQPQSARSAQRFGLNSAFRFSNAGFRIARTAP